MKLHVHPVALWGSSEQPIAAQSGFSLSMLITLANLGNAGDLARYLGSGIERARSPARSPYQSVSAVGSIAVGVARPSCSTVMLALSPLTVTISTFPAPFSVRNSLPLAARMPSGPLTGLSIQMSTGLPALPPASVG